VFRVKLEELRQRLLYNDILGKVKAYVYVVEFDNAKEVQDHLPRAVRHDYLCRATQQEGVP
jgi:hypothetical protein